MGARWPGGGTSAEVAGIGGMPAIPRIELSSARFSARRRSTSAPCRATSPRNRMTSSFRAESMRSDASRARVYRVDVTRLQIS